MAQWRGRSRRKGGLLGGRPSLPHHSAATASLACCTWQHSHRASHPPLLTATAGSSMARLRGARLALAAVALFALALAGPVAAGSSSYVCLPGGDLMGDEIRIDRADSQGACASACDSANGAAA